MPTLERLSAAALREMVITFRDTLTAHAEDINRLNVYPVPDGDTGTNMARTLDAVVAELLDSGLELGPTCAAISHGSLMGARGNSGVILSQILRGMANTWKDASEASASKVAEGLKNGSLAAYDAVLRPVEGTILTVVRESADAAQQSATEGASLSQMLRAARVAGRASLARTPEMLAALKDAGVVDAGGAGFLLLLDSAIHVVDGDPLPAPEIGGGVVSRTEAGEQPAGTRPGSPHGARNVAADVADLAYEVMYFLDLADDRIAAFKQAWGEIGDSIVVVGGDGTWNCHVHTNDIGAAVEVALDHGGRPRQIRVTDLFYEVTQDHATRVAERAGTTPAGRRTSISGMPAVTCAVVAVSSGEGLTDLFVQLGVQAVISGGQTLNPSTAELLSAVESVNAEQVIVLPNNKNIIPVAEQLDALTTKTVMVVGTRSMPEALAALVVYDPEASAASNADEMSSAAASVATGEVTRAVRDTASDAGPVNAGDWIGLVRDDGIVSVDTSLVAAATALLAHLVSDEREIVTLIEGSQATGSTTDALREWLSRECCDVQVEVHHGGQPLYPYLFGVE